MIPYPGPLFYPHVGKVAVMDGGARIEVWANESESPDCFTGLMLREGRSYAQRVVLDLSCMWLRACIHHIEEPTADDIALGDFMGSPA